MELETARLLMRQWRESDFEIYATYYASEETARFVGGHMSRDKAWRHMAAIVGHWFLRGFGIWAVEEKATAQFVGAVGLWEPEGWPELEIGYWLIQSKHGLGYATEAAVAARDHAYRTLGARTLVSYIDPQNAPSRRVAMRMGAQLEQTIDLCGLGPHCVYRHQGPEVAERAAPAFV